MIVGFAALLFLGLLGATTGGDSKSPLVFFQDPPGDIYCAIDAGEPGREVAICELVQFSGYVPPEPLRCDREWRPIAYLEASGLVRLFGCVDPDETLLAPGTPVLAHGRVVVRGSIACRSAADGIACWLPSGRGFHASPTGLERF